MSVQRVLQSFFLLNLIVQKLLHLVSRRVKVLLVFLIDFLGQFGLFGIDGPVLKLIHDDLLLVPGAALLVSGAILACH